MFKSISNWFKERKEIPNNSNKIAEELNTKAADLVEEKRNEGVNKTVADPPIESYHRIESYSLVELENFLNSTVEIQFKKYDIIKENIVMDEVFEKAMKAYNFNAGKICEKILLCCEDKNMHSWSYADPVSKIQFETSVIPSSLDKARSYFYNLKPTGYITFLNWIVNDYQFSLDARERGVKVLVHLIICVNKPKNSNDKIEVQFTFLPLGNREDCPQPIMPVELLSNEEKNKLA